MNDTKDIYIYIFPALNRCLSFRQLLSKKHNIILSKPKMFFPSYNDSAFNALLSDKKNSKLHCISTQPNTSFNIHDKPSSWWRCKCTIPKNETKLHLELLTQCNKTNGIDNSHCMRGGRICVTDTDNQEDYNILCEFELTFPNNDPDHEVKLELNEMSSANDKKNISLQETSGLLRYTYDGYYEDDFSYFKSKNPINVENGIKAINVNGYNDEFSARTRVWVGQLIPLISGKYDFKTNSKYSSQVFIAPQGKINLQLLLPQYRVVDNSGKHSYQEQLSDDPFLTNLKRDTKYTIIIVHGVIGNIKAQMSFHWKHSNSEIWNYELTNDNKWLMFDGIFENNIINNDQEDISHKTVFIPGISSYTPFDYTANPSYWSIGETVEGKDVIFVNIGYFSSVHDAACDIYAQLKGGYAHYGKHHSQKCGHSERGKYIYQAQFPEWDKNNRISIVAHSNGVFVSYHLQYLLSIDYWNDNTTGCMISVIIGINSMLNGSLALHFLSPTNSFDSEKMTSKGLKLPNRVNTSTILKTLIGGYLSADYALHLTGLNKYIYSPIYPFEVNNFTKFLSVLRNVHPMQVEKDTNLWSCSYQGARELQQQWKQATKEGRFDFPNRKTLYINFCGKSSSDDEIIPNITNYTKNITQYLSAIACNLTSLPNEYNSPINIKGHDGVLTTVSQTFPFEYNQPNVYSHFEYECLSKIYQTIIDLTNDVNITENKELIIKRGRFNFTVNDFCHDFRIGVRFGIDINPTDRLNFYKMILDLCEKYSKLKDGYTGIGYEKNFWDKQYNID